MSEQDRAEIAERLIASLEDSPEMDVEQAWQDEVRRRINDIESGKAVCIPWEELRRRLRNKAP